MNDSNYRSTKEMINVAVAESSHCQVCHVPDATVIHSPNSPSVSEEHLISALKSESTCSFEVIGLPAVISNGDRPENYRVLEQNQR